MHEINLSSTDEDLATAFREAYAKAETARAELEHRGYTLRYSGADAKFVKAVEKII